ncbi:hypothetical protein SAMN03159473_01967 [Pseudomonas sp. NFACC52]|nr:hypothetical protein SAMN03159481_03321 [Pseudomonas sp. NFACC56-3]SFK42496.1 hypothetical protein SAMN03159473_01967 [Pseudomonas sp. NFACC52]
MFAVAAVFVGVYHHTHPFSYAFDTGPYIDNDADRFMTTDDSHLSFFTPGQYRQVCSANTGEYNVYFYTIGG